jgi:hypothetical protein
MPARVASITPLVLRFPRLTQAEIAPFVTPLQLHTCMSTGIASMLTLPDGAPMSKRSEMRSSGTGVLRSYACVK